MVSRVRSTGTNTGGMPWFGIPANDAKVDFEWIQISRHEADDRIAETWAQIEICEAHDAARREAAPEAM